MRLTPIGLLVTAACLLAGGITLVAGAGVDKQKTGTINACAKKQDGRLRMVAGAANCKRGERAVRWNVEGPQGPAGAQGPAGEKGTAGSVGPAGPVGPVGSVGPAGSVGSPGATGPAGAIGPAGAAGGAGPIGPAGPAGAQGATGPAGPAGARGPAGTGITSLEDLNGVACHAGTQAGTVALSYDASGHAVLTCGAGGGGGGGESGPIKVNEFSTGVTSAATNEFVEIYNAGTAAVDVSGYKVVYRSAAGSSDTTLATLPAGTSLAPGAFYLLGGSGYAGAVPEDQSFGTAIAATGGSLGVKTATGTLTDAVAYGTATNGLGEGLPATAPPTTAAPGSSAIRLPDGHDTESNSVDFAATAHPTPKAANAAS